MSEPLFERLTLIGIGLIGSSIARAAKVRGVVRHITICDESAVHLARAEELELGDRYCGDAGEAAEGADLVLLCTPVGVSGALTKRMGAFLKPGAILSDVGSTKATVVGEVRPHVPEGVHFIAGHPLAGTEQSGPDAGFSSLFESRWCILTPDQPDADAAAIAALSRFWEGLGSTVDIMDPDHHDRVLAIVSHLPHLIAYNIVGTADDLETVTKSEVIKYSASGFRDFTRLAASDPTMWRDVCLHNKDAILEMLGRFSEDLAALQRAVRWGDGDQLFDLFTRTRGIRRSIIEAGQETDEPDFGRHHPKD
ncbi:prephenate/arogenate dehydrogenase family protein [Roseibium sp. CAU 1637]|uniref:prephenate dehydrogenase n=1 Tax=Roseibium limicola TaxID=2816037 RepID=A0A939ES35_9HYPH|nr:prephenate/arogenate dehydrogenase family protein [Roseibium limicola]MBO0347072.1 prephenate/arogenate dehydrogenase family protein [Roseibium limicola]